VSTIVEVPLPLPRLPIGFDAGLVVVFRIDIDRRISRSSQTAAGMLDGAGELAQFHIGDLHWFLLFASIHTVALAACFLCRLSEGIDLAYPAKATDNRGHRR